MLKSPLHQGRGLRGGKMTTNAKKFTIEMKNRRGRSKIEEDTIWRKNASRGFTEAADEPSA